MPKKVSGCLIALAAAVAVCILILGGALDVSLDFHIPPAFLRRSTGAIDEVLEMNIERQERDTLDLYDEPQSHRKLQGLQLSHSRQPKYSIYTGEHSYHFLSLKNLRLAAVCWIGKHCSRDRPCCCLLLIRE